jgi:precorrin-6B methylase 2
VALLQADGAGTRLSVDPRLLLMHQVMLADRVRLAAYGQALATLVGAGDVVADVGAGTLVLAMLALERGARHVYAIEGDDQTVELARQVVAHNRLESRITVVHGDARVVTLPEKVDLIVSEMMGNLGPEEEMAEILGAAAERNLKAQGRIVPARLVTELRAIEFDQEGWGVWSTAIAGYSLGVMQEFAPPEAQVHFFTRPPTLLSSPAVLADQRLGAPASFDDGPHHLAITATGTLHAIMGHFTATVADGVTLSNFPSYPGCNWGVWIWPVRHTPVAPGDRVRVSVHRPRFVRDVARWTLDCSVARGRDGT